MFGLAALPIFAMVLSTLSPTSRFLVEPSGLHLAFTEHPYELSLMWSSLLPLWDSTVLFRETNCRDAYEVSDWTEFEPVWSWNFKHYSKSWEVIYKVVITGVFPECEYEYIVGSGVIWTVPHRIKVRTPYDPGAPLPADFLHPVDFLVFGDLGSGDHSALSRALLLRFITNRHIDGLLHLGDIAYDLDSVLPGVARAYFKEMEPITSTIPYMVIPGNHEMYENYTQYIRNFRMPANEANGGLGKYYSFDFGRAHFLLFCSDTINTGLRYERERHMQWIRDDLKEANRNRETVPWLIVIAHKPFYCQVDYRMSFDSNSRVENNKDCTSKAIRFKWMLEELFNFEGVDLVLTGHVHNYQRTTPLHHNVTIPSDYDDRHVHINAKAPVFITTGTAGNKEGNDPISATPQLWCMMQSRELGIGHLQVFNSTHLYWEQWSAVNKQMIDYVWLQKYRSRY